MNWVKGFDNSFDYLTPQEADRLAADGFKVMGQCLSTGVTPPAAAWSNIITWSTVGPVVGYISLRQNESNPEQVIDRAFAANGSVWPRVTRFAIDTELTGITPTKVFNAGEYLSTKYNVDGRHIYTNFNTWANLMGNPVIPAGWGLWNAWWDNDPDFDFASHPYGGNDVVCWGEQWKGGHTEQGQMIDSDIFDLDSLVPPTPAPPAPGPTQVDVLYALNRAGYLTLQQESFASLLEDDKRVFRWIATQL